MMSSIEMTCRHSEANSTAGSRFLASFWVETITALAPLLAADFIALDSDGTLRSKAEVLARVKKGKWTVNEIADMKVTVHGDSAIVTGSWTGKGTDGAGKAVDAKERWVDTWTKAANGPWQCIASASAPMK